MGNWETDGWCLRVVLLTELGLIPKQAVVREELKALSGYLQLGHSVTGTLLSAELGRLYFP
jgi:hypothetical protein